MKDLTSPALLSETIGCIYDSALDPTKWLVAVEHVKAAIGKTTAGISLVDNEARAQTVRWFQFRAIETKTARLTDISGK